MLRGSPEKLLAFEQEVKAIDPKVLVTAMGGIDTPPEEPLLASMDDGYGYSPTTSVGTFMGQYKFIRKVSISQLFLFNTLLTKYWIQLGWANSSSVVSA